MRGRLVIAGLGFLVLVLASALVASRFLASSSAFPVGTTAVYEERVKVGPTVYVNEFNVTVTGVRGDLINFTYTITESQNATLTRPYSTKNETVLFTPSSNSSYVFMKLFGLPVFASGLKTASGNLAVYFEGVPYAVKYSETAEEVNFTFQSYQEYAGRPAVYVSFNGTYTEQGLLKSCSIYTRVLSAYVYENCTLLASRIAARAFSRSGGKGQNFISG